MTMPLKFFEMVAQMKTSIVELGDIVQKLFQKVT